MERYNPLLVSLHWVMAILVIVTLLSGGIAPLDFHLTSGVLIAVLTILRVGVKLTTRGPQQASEKDSLQAQLAHWMHLALYGLLFGIVASGMGMAIEAGLFQEPTMGAHTAVGFSDSPLRAAHAVLTKLLLIAIAAHVLAALWHQFIKRDRLFSRMWFAR